MCVCVCVFVCVHMILMYVLSLRHYFFSELIVTLSNVHCLSSLSSHLEFIASTGEWVLVDVVTNRQRATVERLSEKTAAISTKAKVLSHCMLVIDLKMWDITFMGCYSSAAGLILIGHEYCYVRVCLITSNGSWYSQ